MEKSAPIYGRIERAWSYGYDVCTSVRITVTFSSYRYSTILFLELFERVQGLDCKLVEIILSRLLSRPSLVSSLSRCNRWILLHRHRPNST